MSIRYTNFRGDVYYLYRRKTSKGNETYYFAKKSNGILVEKLPAGYEIYEEPNGKVYFRKPLKQLFTEKEIGVVHEKMNQHCPIQDYKLDIKKEYLYIYTIANNVNNMPFNMATRLDETTLAKVKTYETNMRFELIDPDERLFSAQRFCFLGGIDDWIDLDCSTNLSSLVTEFVTHLGQDSFYDLM